MQWMLGNALGGIKLRVPQEMVDDALRILNEKAPELPAEPDDEYKAGEIKCPSCGSTNVRAEKYSRSIFAWTWMLLGFPVPVPAEKVHKCFNCGHEWRA